MGKGKGSVELWVRRVKPGRIMFEIDGVPEDAGGRGDPLGAAKLPIGTRFVRRVQQVEEAAA